MRDFLLLTAVAAAFVFGCLIVKKLDRFLESNHQAQTGLLPSGESSLQIGLSNPLVADGLSDALGRYSQIQPHIAVCLYSGTEEELNHALSAHELDVVFLPEGASAPENIHVTQVRLNLTPLMMKYVGLPIKPIAQDLVLQNVLWLDSKKMPVVCDFIACLRNGTAVPELPK